MASRFMCVLIALAMSGCSEDEPKACEPIADGAPVDLRVAWRLEGDCISHGIDKLQVNLDGPTTDSLSFACGQEDSGENFHGISAGVYQIKVSALASDGNVLAVKRKQVDFGNHPCALLELVIVMEFEATDFM